MAELQDWGCLGSVLQRQKANWKKGAWDEWLLTLQHFGAEALVLCPVGFCLLLLTLSWCELQHCSHASLAPCKIFSTVSDNHLVSFTLVADYYHLTVHVSTKQHFHLYRQTAGHNTLLATQRLIKRNSCMLDLVVFEIQVVPSQRGKASSILLHSTDKVENLRLLGSFQSRQSGGI